MNSLNFHSSTSLTLYIHPVLYIDGLVPQPFGILTNQNFLERWCGKKPHQNGTRYICVVPVSISIPPLGGFHCDVACPAIDGWIGRKILRWGRVALRLVSHTCYQLHNSWPWNSFFVFIFIVSCCCWLLLWSFFVSSGHHVNASTSALTFNDPPSTAPVQQQQQPLPPKGFLCVARERVSELVSKWRWLMITVSVPLVYFHLLASCKGAELDGAAEGAELGWVGYWSM